MSKSKRADLQTMKRTILAEIKEVSQSDLKVMTVQEITDFYNQLVSGCTEGASQINAQEDKAQTKTVKQSVNELLDKNNEVTPNFTKSQNGNNSLFQDDKANKILEVYLQAVPTSQSVQIEGKQYYKPSYLTECSYLMSNKRFNIISNPILKKKSQKRQALRSVYGDSIPYSLTYKEASETYDRLRLRSDQQLLPLSITQSLQPKTVLVYVQYEQLDQKPHFFARAQKKNKITQVNSTILQNNQTFPEANELEVDQFFDQHYQNIKQSPQLLKQKPTVSSPSLRQTIQSVKKKDRLQNSVQTDKMQKRQKRIKTQMTILSQVQFVEDTEEDQYTSANDLIQIADEDEELLNTVHKIKIDDIKRALMQPDSKPKPEIIQWVKCMKNLLANFQKQYFGQFNSKWTQIQN